MERNLVKLAGALLSLVIVTGFIACNKTPPGTLPNTLPTTSQNASVLKQSPPSQSLPGGAFGTKPAVKVSGSGIIAAASYANLYFGTGGKVEKISVKEGDRVNKGTVLAKLNDTSLEVALAQARVALDQAELAQTQAKTTLESAQFTLEKTKKILEIKNEITSMRWEVKVGEMQRRAAQNSNINYSTQQTGGAQSEISSKTQDLATLLGQAEYVGFLTYDILAEQYDTLSTEDLEIKELQVESARQTLTKSQNYIEQARKSLALAQEQLDQATIVAQFDGVVAEINYREGDVVPPSTQAQRPIIYFIDPNTMELTISVNELDIPSVKIGQRASIGIDAFPGVKIEGKVKAISPAPTIQGGIVDYDVTMVLSVPSDMRVNVGMNANAQIIIE